MFDPDERDGYNDPAIYLRERLQQLGYDLKTADDNPLDECAWVLFHDAASVKTCSGWRGPARKLKRRLLGRPLARDLYGECMRAGMEQRMALFLWEAPAVSPENWDPELQKMFPIIFTWHDQHVDRRKFIKIYHPQTRRFLNVPEIAFKDRKLLVNITANKHSRHPKELYSARRAAIRYFERVHPDSFDLFGVGWDRPPTRVARCLPWTRRPYPAYRGTIRNKWEVLPNYRFSLCYENVRDEPGYVTEKIFDSLRCGCVPVYWGAPNIRDYVDAEAFIDRRRFKSNAELDQYLSGMTERDYAQFQDAIRLYLAGPRFARFLPPAYADTIINTLKLKS